MRAMAWLVLYCIGVFCGGALLAPWLYQLAQWGAVHWPWTARLAQEPFHRFVLRAILLLALAGLWPLLRHFRMFEWAALGLAPSALTKNSDDRGLPASALAKAGSAAAQAAAGLAVGFVSLACVALLAVLAGNRAINLGHSPGQTLHFLTGAITAALLVAPLEELIFRASLFGLLRRFLPWPRALVLSSLVYAAVHFLQKAQAVGPIHWYSGLWLLARMFRNLADLDLVLPAFFTLTVAGAILALAYQRSGLLYASIGLHAGWIFWLKSFRFLTRQTIPVPAPQSFWGTDNLVDGWAAFLLLSLILAIAWLAWPGAKADRQKRPSDC